MPKIKVNKDPAIGAESWFKTRWRPAMAWLYMVLIAYDFILAPIGWPLVAYFLKITPILAWSPLTLQGGGFIHITFGAILGIYTYGRTKEIVEGKTSDTSNQDDNDESDEDDKPIKTPSKSDVP